MTDCDQRNHSLLAELRAEIDSTVEDEISDIIRNMPEEYFLSLSRRDQMTHLKALLAMIVCGLQDEIMLRSHDGSQIAVIAKRSYPGLLANILKRLPSDLPLIGATAFTSKQHDFIIDLFQFKAPDTEDIDETWQETVEFTATQVARMTGAEADEVARFVRSYHRGNHVLSLSHEVAEQFLAFQGLQHANDIHIRWHSNPDRNVAKIVVAVGSASARDVFERAAEFLAQESIDVEQAYFDDLQISPDWHNAIVTFNVNTAGQSRHECCSERLRTYLRVDQEVIRLHLQDGESADLEDTEVFFAVTRLAGHLIHFGGEHVPFRRVQMIALDHRTYVCHLLDGMRRRLSVNGLPEGAGQQVDQQQASVKTNQPAIRLVLSAIESIAQFTTAWNLTAPGRRSMSIRLGSVP